VLSFSDRLKSTSLTTVSKLHIAYGVVQVSAWMVGILLHSCSQRQHSNDLQLVCRLSRVNDDEISNELRMCAQSELLTEDTVLRRMRGAISYKFRTA
jgi:hypothetical protein